MRQINGMTEEEAVAIIYKVAKRLAYKYRFGYHDVEDIKQVAVRIALEKIEEKYDESKPLENFLSIVLKNALFNYRRDNYERLDKPCLRCPLKAYIKKDDKCTAYCSKLECEPYASWAARNESRKNIMGPINLDDVDYEHESNMVTNSDVQLLELKEIIDIIEKNIPIDYYKDWIKFKNGNKLPARRKSELLSILQNIIREHTDYV